MVFIYNGILPAIKKTKILPFVKAWVDLKCIMLIEIRQTKKNAI